MKLIEACGILLKFSYKDVNSRRSGERYEERNKEMYHYYAPNSLKRWYRRKVYKSNCFDWEKLEDRPDIEEERQYIMNPELFMSI